MIRLLIERLLRNTVVKRRLPSAFGSIPLYVSPDAQLKYLKPRFDEDLLEVVSTWIQPDSIVWDVGANVGVFALAAAARAAEGQVLAIEPDIWLAGLIGKSVTLTPRLVPRISVLPAAISSKNGVETFLIANRGRASNALESAGGRSQMGGVRKRVCVCTLTLDTLLESCPGPTFLKIDVEGAELEVLRGARRVLDEIRPVMHIEVDESLSGEVSTFLLKSNYVLFDGAAPYVKSNSLKECVFNTLAIPEERVH
jgi:FkbM family methyltransferase